MSPYETHVELRFFSVRNRVEKRNGIDLLSISMVPTWKSLSSVVRLTVDFLSQQESRRLHELDNYLGIFLSVSSCLMVLRAGRCLDATRNLLGLCPQFQHDVVMKKEVCEELRWYQHQNREVDHQLTYYSPQ